MLRCVLFFLDCIPVGLSLADLEDDPREVAFSVDFASTMRRSFVLRNEK